MDCQASDSKRLLKVFDAAKSRKCRRKRDDDTTADTDGSASVPLNRTASAEACFQVVHKHRDHAGPVSRERESSPDELDSSPAHRCSRSPKKYRRPITRREGISLALKAGMASSPRSSSQQRDAEVDENATQDQDSFIYTLLTEAIESDKKKQRHARRIEERFDREASNSRHRHRRRREEVVPSPKQRKQESPVAEMNQTMILETFAKLCSQMKERTMQSKDTVPRTLSHKSLQCEVEPKIEPRQVYETPRARIRSREHSRENVPSPARVRSQGHISVAGQSRVALYEDKCPRCYDKDKYYSKIDVRRDRHDYDITPTRSRIDAREHGRDRYDYRDYDRRDRERNCDKRQPVFDKERYIGEKTSRSFDIRREPYIDEDRRTPRSDRRFEEKRYFDRKYDERRFMRRDRRCSKRNLDANFDRASIVSRDEDYYRERDCVSVADDASSVTVSGKSNYLRTVKQEIQEQREAMEKMMKLWRELMRCFKNMNQNQGPAENKNMQESAASARDSAEAQLRLWQECMRRYETVARDVGDTDARLMEEINKQRSEMAEMAHMWQECLQRYREMSTDFNTLKQKVDSKTVPLEVPCPRAMPPPMICAEGEGTTSVASYRLPPNYPQPPQLVTDRLPSHGGSPLRGRASAPPAWWWGGERQYSPRRRSSPESRGSRDRERRHRHRERDDSRYKEKSKPSMARSEHRHRKR